MTCIEKMWSLRRSTITYFEAITKFSRTQLLYSSCSYSDLSCTRKKTSPLQERKMIDRFRLCAKGGDGGNGCFSYRRSRHDRRGRPDVIRGLGHAFLRHIERTKALAYVVDLGAGIDGRKGMPPWEQLKELMLELELYREGLSGRPSLVVANKIDEAGAEQVFEELKERVHGVPIFPVCAVLEEGVPELKAALKMLVSGENLSTLKLDSIMLH